MQRRYLHVQCVYSTMYIPHTLLKERMTKLITDAFFSRIASHIKIDEKVTQARWSNKPQNANTGEYHVDVNRLIKMFNL